MLMMVATAAFSGLVGAKRVAVNVFPNVVGLGERVAVGLLMGGLNMVVNFLVDGLDFFVVKNAFIAEYFFESADGVVGLKLLNFFLSAILLGV